MTEEASDIPPALSGASAMSGVASPVSGEPNTETITDRQEASEPGLPEPLAAQAPAPAGDPSAPPPPPGTEPNEKTDLGANTNGALLSSGSTGSVSPSNAEIPEDLAQKIASMPSAARDALFEQLLNARGGAVQVAAAANKAKDTFVRRYERYRNEDEDRKELEHDIVKAQLSIEETSERSIRKPKRLSA